MCLGSTREQEERSEEMHTGGEGAVGSELVRDRSAIPGKYLVFIYQIASLSSCALSLSTGNVMPVRHYRAHGWGVYIVLGWYT